MGIDRHNCEEWFLLYADNELEPAERRMVEEFASSHRDVAMLLDGILKARIKPDRSVRFDARDSLIKKEGDPTVQPITEADLERLLSMVDGESKDGERDDFEKELKQNPAWNKEWDLLSRTRLQPDPSITFPDRASLYRKQSGYPVMRWFSLSAAAALLILLGLWQWQGREGKTEVSSNHDVSVKAPATPLSPAAVTVESSVQTTTQQPSQTEPMARMVGEDKTPEVPLPVSKPVDTEWRESIVKDVRTMPEKESSMETEADRPVAVESMAVNEERTKPSPETSKPERDTQFENEAVQTLRYVKTDYATEALIEAVSDPESHSRQRKPLFKGGLRVATRTADRYYNKITNPSFEPKPIEVRWTSNRQ
jgi:hypothetical protein